MRLNAFFALLQDKFKKLSDVYRVITLVAFIIFSYILLTHLVDWIKTVTHKEPEPSLIREQGLIKIPPHSPIRKVLKVTPITQKQAPIELTIPGVIETKDKRDVNIVTPMEGRLVKIPVRLGQMVELGDVLAVLRSPTLAQLNSDYLAALSSVNLTTKLYERALKVNLAGANAKKDVEIALNNLNAARAQAKSLGRKIKILGTNKYSIFYLRAPYKSFVTNIHLGVGAYVSNLDTPIMTLNNIEKVWVTTFIPEVDLRYVKPGQPVNFSLNAFPNEHFNGHISFISPRMNMETRSNSVRITILNPDDRFKPDMFATVKIMVPQLSKIILPSSAILMDYESTSVFVEQSPWVFERRNVELGYEQHGEVEILSGLKIGEKVAVKGGIFIND